MCGITGIFHVTEGPPPEESELRQMLAMIRHRGPDQFGIYLDEQTGLGNARLSIIDPEHGQQPLTNEDGTLWIVFNGEIFNHRELRRELENRGHRFTTRCDTEVVIHAYEEYGSNCLSRFNGQFAFAIRDLHQRSLFLARDRLGVRPLFYTRVQGTLIFGSEIKAMLAHPQVTARIDPVSLDQIFTYWSPLSPRTIFCGIQELPPGHFLQVRDGEIVMEAYWKLNYPRVGSHPGTVALRTKDHCLDELRSLLIDATQIRLQADVPVGAYLSGGLDSSAIAAIIRNFSSTSLDTFSIAFSDTEFDESVYQQKMAQFLGTDHHVIQATHTDIGRVFPEVIWHTECPILRTSPAPMFLLSKLVHDRGFKVVLTGEGADEILAGYDVFKEAKVRRFWARRPSSKWRPSLIKHFYPWISGMASSSAACLEAFFSMGLNDTENPNYSHSLRWRTTGRCKRFFSEATREAIQADSSPGEAPPFPEDFAYWDPLHQAEYLEITTFLSPYLLSSQSDRVTMAHSVEGRFPFLDHRVVEFCNGLPPTLKLRGLTEKYLLKELSREWLPEEIWNRPKRPFRAPVHRSFFNGTWVDGIRELLSPGEIASAGVFHPDRVSQLAAKLERGMALSETDDMALVGILSTQLVIRQFISTFRRPCPLSTTDPVKVIAMSSTMAGR